MIYFKPQNRAIKSVFSILMVSMFFACTSLKKTDNQSKEDFKIIGYVAGYEKFDVAEIDAAKLTHLNYAFANIVDGNVQFELATDKAKIESIMALKKQNPDLKVLYSIGGWVWSDQFSNIAAYASSREKFAKSAVHLMKTYGFDGIDIDWEFPGQRAEDNVFRPSDKENFTLLLGELRAQLEIETKADNKHYLLSIAAATDQEYLNHTDLKKAHQYLDFINLMCYDFYNGWFYQTGHQANLYPSKEEKFGGNSISESIDKFLKQGVPSNKLILGIPFYGRKWEKVTAERNGLYQSAQTGSAIVPSWEIAEELKSGKFQEFYDDAAKASFLWNAQDNIFISYDTPKEIVLKAAFIKQKKLGGAMFWEYSLDNKKVLLNKLYESAGTKNK
ncbi:chitinase [Flavobacterium cheongpyeongense]|uniref:chitinase n=1 Tax=Flavobacterium cheongpyeongense TaxID=2212651 RepID=A0A2V4BK60_9FLAO|nr:glycoside hydrolase family 18 protein [Flavobacterium cheongpyeongense]PXY39171.1 chitinase [Flavobacterium cheongpyeongense]